MSFDAHINQIIFATDSTKDFEVETGGGTYITACFIEIENHKEHGLPQYAVLFKSAINYYIDENEEENEEEMTPEEALRELFRFVSPAYSKGPFCEMITRETKQRFPVCWQTGEGNYSFMPKAYNQKQKPKSGVYSC